MQNSISNNFQPGKTFIIGANSFIGSYFLAAYRLFYPDCMGSSIRDDSQLLRIDLLNPDIRPLKLKSKGYNNALICAGITGVNKCEIDSKLSWKINVEGTLKIIEQLCDENIRPIYLSSDYVFDGHTGNYSEDSPVNPINLYGTYKATVEKAIPQICGSNYIILRLSKIFSTDINTKSFLSEMIADIITGKTINAAFDQIFCPTLISDLQRTIFEIQNKNLSGLFNVCSTQSISRYTLAKRIAQILNVNSDNINRISIDDLSEKFNRPHNTSMICNRLNGLNNSRFTPIDDCISVFSQNWSNCNGKK
jgi:dTDP-4-dehydrorhamnose reductase